MSKDKTFHTSVYDEYTPYETLLNVFKDKGSYYAVYCATQDEYMTRRIRIVKLISKTNKSTLYTKEHLYSQKPDNSRRGSRKV